MNHNICVDLHIPKYIFKLSFFATFDWQWTQKVRQKWFVFNICFFFTFREGEHFWVWELWHRVNWFSSHHALTGGHLLQIFFPFWKADLNHIDHSEMNWSLTFLREPVNNSKVCWWLFCVKSCSMDITKWTLCCETRGWQRVKISGGPFLWTCRKLHMAFISNIPIKLPFEMFITKCNWQPKHINIVLSSDIGNANCFLLVELGFWVLSTGFLFPMQAICTMGDFDQIAIESKSLGDNVFKK